MADDIIVVLNEIKRVPWYRSIADSLEGWYKKGKFSDKQHAYMMSLYVDSCIISDEEIEQQLEARHLVLDMFEAMFVQNLINEKSSRTRNFIISLRNYRRKLSVKQINAIHKISKRYKRELAKVEKKYEPNDWEINVL